MDLFIEKSIQPMLIGAEGNPFDDAGYVYELKLDGERCIAYLAPDTGTDLRNKRNMKMLPKVPELDMLHTHVRVRCILDGELAVLVNGKPDFSQIQRRSLMSNPYRIALAAKQYPACFTAFDILYHKDKTVTHLPLMKRKELLQKVVQEESDQFAISRFVEKNGTAFFALTKEQGLEGIVAKGRESKYYFGKRTKEWIKIKAMLDEDFVVCGFIPKDNSMTSIVLGQYDGGVLSYQGHVTMGVGGEAFHRIASLPIEATPPFFVPEGNGEIRWVKPCLVCTVKYMQRTASGGMRQPVFKGLREDKQAEECRRKH